MEIGHFGHFYEFFAGLNFAYAGSKTFRDLFDQKILRLSNVITTTIGIQFSLVRDSVNLNTAEPDKIPEQIRGVFLSKIDTISKKFELEKRNLRRIERKRSKFSKPFKAMFLASALYCLLMILIGGYQQFFYEEEVTNASVVCFHPILIVNLSLFLFSFNRKITRKNFRPTYVVICLLFLLLSTLFFCHTSLKFVCNHIYFSCGNAEKFNITLSLFIAISPFMFQLLRILYHRKKYQYMYRKLAEKTSESLEKAQDWINFLEE